MTTAKGNRTTAALEKSLDSRKARKYVLRLYVAGASRRSLQAILRARELCAEELKDGCELQVIDIFQQPHLARSGQIVATPTLVKMLPLPVRRFIGDLADTSSVSAGFALKTAARAR